MALFWNGVPPPDLTSHPKERRRRSPLYRHTSELPSIRERPNDDPPRAVAADIEASDLLTHDEVERASASVVAGSIEQETYLLAGGIERGLVGRQGGRPQPWLRERRATLYEPRFPPCRAPPTTPHHARRQAAQSRTGIGQCRLSTAQFRGTP